MSELKAKKELKRSSWKTKGTLNELEVVRESDNNHRVCAIGDYPCYIPDYRRESFEATIISQAPEIIQSFIDVRNQLIDSGHYTDKSILIVAIDNQLKDFTE